MLRLVARGLDVPIVMVAVQQAGEMRLTGCDESGVRACGALSAGLVPRLLHGEPFVLDNHALAGDPVSGPLHEVYPAGVSLTGVPIAMPDETSRGMLFLVHGSQSDVVCESPCCPYVPDSAREAAAMVGCYLSQRRHLDYSTVERRRVVEHMRFLARVLDHIEEPVVSLDRSFRIVYFNEPAARLCGVSVAEAIGRPLSTILDYSWVKREDARQYRRSLATAGVWRGRNRVKLRRSGASIVVESAISIVHSEKGERVGYLGILRDTTERSRFEEQLRQSNQELRALVDSAPVGIIGLDAAGHVARWNKSAERIFGWHAAQVRGQALPTLDGVAEVEFASMRRRILTGDSFTGTETRWLCKDGRQIDISLSAAPLRDADGHIDGIMLIVDDITAKTQALEALAQAEHNYRSIFENAFEGIFQSTPDGKYIRANAALARMYGYDSPDELIRSLTNIRHQLYVDPVRRAEFIRLMHEREAISEFEAQVYRKDGSIIWISESARGVRDSAGRVLYYEGMVADISGRKATEADQQRKLAEAMERADRDPLTMLFNHRAFHKRLHSEIERATAIDERLAVVLIDLDNFKFFNDVYGHSVGDDVLRQVAMALAHSCRVEDVLARYGGDEFALIMPGLSRDAALAAADRINRCLDDIGYRPPGYNAVIPFSMAVGVATLPEDGVTRFALIEAADASLRQAKSGCLDDGYADRLRSRLLESIQGFSMLDALVKAVDTKDRYTRRHSEDVMSYSLDIARRMRLTDKEQRAAEVAGLLHDVGKIGVPDSILRKPGKLSDSDMLTVKQHPMMGAIIVGAVPGFEDALDAVRHHHERWDGGGYPFGLVGPQIPLLARIMAVADAYSAMTTDRPYRKGMPPEEALRVLEEGSGTQWDPECVAVFVRARRALNTQMAMSA